MAETYAPAHAPRYDPQGSQHSEVGPLLAWNAWQHGEPLAPPGPLPAQLWRMGLTQPGSDNHGPMLASAWLLRACKGQTGGYLAEGWTYAVDWVVRLFETQRTEGHRCKEFGGYSHFHYGAAATLAIVGHAFDKELWRYALGWWADELACLRLLRCPDGQVLVVGSRQRPHVPADTPVFHEAFPAIVCQMLDPIPVLSRVPWLDAILEASRVEALGPWTAVETATTHPACGFGWLKPASARAAVCLRQVLAAIQLGALPLDLIRRAAEGRRPRIAGELGVRDGEFSKIADMRWLHGGPQQCYRSLWFNDGRRPFTSVRQSLSGFGRHQSPSPGLDIPVLLHPSLPISDLPLLPGSTPEPSPRPDSPHPGGWPAPGGRIPYTLVGGEIVMPERSLTEPEFAVLAGLRAGSGPGGPWAQAVFDALVREGVVVANSP